MNSKKFLLAVVMLLAGICMQAASLEVKIQTSGDNNVTASLSTVKSLTIDGDNFVINLTDGSKLTTPLTSITKISVGEGGGTGVSTINAGDAVAIATDGATLHILGINGATPLNVYTTGGQCVINTEVSDGDYIDISILPPGIYIATMGSESLKFIRR